MYHKTLFTLLTEYWICIPLYTFYKFINIATSLTKHSYHHCYIITYQYTIIVHHCWTMYITIPMHNTVYTAVYIPLTVDDDKNGLCICCCTYYITTSIFSHISYTRTHHCSLSTHHYTLLYTSCTLKPIYITTLLIIEFVKIHQPWLRLL